MLTLLKWLPFLSKLSVFSKFLAFVPGAQIFGLVGSLIGLIGSFIKWLLADIADAFKDPPRLVVRTVCFLAILALGVHQGIKWDAHKVDAARAQTKLWQEAHQKLLDDAKTVDRQDKSAHAKAMAAKLKAEQDERAKIEAEKAAKSPYMQVKPVQTVPVKPADTPSAVQPDGVQPKRATKTSHCQKRNQQESLFGLNAVFGGGLSCKST